MKKRETISKLKKIWISFIELPMIDQMVIIFPPLSSIIDIIYLIRTDSIEAKLWILTFNLIVIFVCTMIAYFRFAKKFRNYIEFTKEFNKVIAAEKKEREEILKIINEATKTDKEKVEQ